MPDFYDDLNRSEWKNQPRVEAGNSVLLELQKKIEALLSSWWKTINFGPQIKFLDDEERGAEMERTVSIHARFDRYVLESPNFGLFDVLQLQQLKDLQILSVQHLIY